MHTAVNSSDTANAIQMPVTPIAVGSNKNEGIRNIGPLSKENTMEGATLPILWK